MHKILITGAGKIGTLIACLLSQAKDYDVTLTDIDFSGSDIQHFLKIKPKVKTVTLDITDQEAVKQFMSSTKFDAVISSLPFYRNEEVAKISKEYGCHYFDLTEDTAVAETIKKLADGAPKAFVPQCGLAPGFVTIVANDIMKNFSSLETVKLRVGALPQHANNVLQYALTWSTEGLINQYGNPCHAIREGKNVILQPLEDLEVIIR